MAQASLRTPQCDPAHSSIRTSSRRRSGWEDQLLVVLWGDNIVGGIWVGVEPVTRGSGVGRRRPFELVAEKMVFAILDQVDFLLVIGTPKVVVGKGAGAGAVLNPNPYLVKFVYSHYTFLA